MFCRKIRLYSTISLPTSGLIKLNSKKKLLSVKGKDSAKFLNGLVTIKLLPSFEKKNRTTISLKDLQDLENLKSLQLSEDEIESRNWGIFHEDESYDDLDKQRMGIRRDGRYCMLLNAKGRVITDMFIYPTPFNPTHSDGEGEPSYLIELDSAKFSQILMMLKFHKLKSKVDLKVVQMDSWFYYNVSESFLDQIDEIKERYFNNAKNKSTLQSNTLTNKFIEDEPIFNADNIGYVNGFAIDDRAPDFGIKFLLPSTIPVDTIFSSKFISNYSTPNIEDISVYDTLRITKGLSEAADFKSDGLPFELNLDYNSGINYNKGCYVGQELTIRSYFSGVIRKRVMPVQFYKLDTNAEEIGDELNYDPESNIFEELNSIDDLEVVKIKAVDEGTSTQPQTSSPSQFTASNPFGSMPITSRRRKGGNTRVGKVVKMDTNIGLASVTVEYVDEDNSIGKNEFTLASKSNPKVAELFGCKVFTPEWWPEAEEEVVEEEEEDGEGYEDEEHKVYKDDSSRAKSG